MSKCIAVGLKSQGLLVDNVYNQPKALCLSEARGYDLLLVDNSSKDIDAFKFCTDVREQNSHIPIIMIASRDSLEVRVEAFMIGFDDIVMQNTPFIEIYFRINRLIRRCSAICDISTILKFDNLTMDTSRREISRGSRNILLRRKEYDLLEYMLHYPDQVLSRHRLLEHVWPEDTFVYTNTVDVHMASVRRKVDSKEKNKLIHTIHGIGYMISAS
jgi:DNA-binding response OmpR family regulator